MPPIRRYVRISPHSCLEVRIFVENPADITTWLLRRSNPALPRIFDAVKPLILPKLREENERTRLAKGKSGKKKKGVKDVVKRDDFEVIVFLTEGHGRHEIAIKRKEAQQQHGQSASDVGTHQDLPVVIPEEQDRDGFDLAKIPMAQDGDHGDPGAGAHRVTSSGEKDEDVDEFSADNKKKLGFTTRYDGFGIWGKVLCLLVERKGVSGRARAGDPAHSAAHPPALVTDTFQIRPGSEQHGLQQALMQEWISSTQLPVDDDEMEEDNG